MAVTTMLDIAKANGSDKVVGLVEEVIKSVPEVDRGFARTIKGYTFKTLVRTGLPTAGFRSANEGVVPSKSTFENRNFECMPLNPRWECDKAIANVYEDGPEAYIALEAAGQMLAALVTLGKQFYYGAGTTNNGNGDAKGHPGLIDSYDATNMVVDAGGTTASTGSSCWGVKFGPTYVSWLWGGNGEMKIEDPVVVRATDGSGNPYSAYMSEMISHVGLQVANTKVVGRIKKLTEDSGKGLTDAKIASLLAKFPVGMLPDVLFCSRRSLMQLQASRTATTQTGAPAPIPTDAFNIPILPTDCILDTESLSL